jgi:hypothetical protein
LAALSFIIEVIVKRLAGADLLGLALLEKLEQGLVFFVCSIIV